MNVRNGVSIKLTNQTLYRLRLLKVRLGMRSYDEVINYLIESYVRGRSVEL